MGYLNIENKPDVPTDYPLGINGIWDAISARSKTNHIDAFPPAGWNLNEQKIDGIPNWILYAAVAGCAVLGARSMKRRKK